MSNDTEFVDGLIVKAPRNGAPEYVKAQISIKREELIAWLSGKGGEWINVDVKVSKNGKWYAAVNDWKPDGQSRSGSQRGQRGGGSQRSGTGYGGGGVQRQQPAQNPPPMDDFSDDDIPF